MKKNWIILRIGIIILAIFMWINFPLLANGAEAEQPEEAEEEDTMLNIMPSLSMPKTPSIEYSIDQQFEYNDNYYLDKGAKKKGRFSSITSPTVVIKYPIGRTYLEGDYAYGFTYYMREQETLSRQYAKIRIYHRPTRRLSMGLTEGFLRNNLPDQEEQIDVKVAGKTFDRNTLAAQMKYEISRKWRIGADGSYHFINFEETPNDAVPANTEFGGGINTEYVIDRRTTLGFFYNFYDTIVTEAEDQKDSLKHDLQIRYSHRIQKAFSIDVYTGYDLIHYDNGEDATGAVAGTDLKFDISRSTKFVLGYDYGLNDSTKKDSLVYRGHTFHADFNHNITPRLAVNALSSYDIWRYDSKYDISNSGSNSNRQSEVMRFQCGLNYKLTKKIDISATYYTSTKVSDFYNDQYFNNIYSVSVRGTF